MFTNDVHETQYLLPGHVDAEPSRRIASDSGDRKSSSATPTITFRATVVGLAIGIPVALANIYFGLQNGYTSSMSMPCAFLGWAVFQTVRGHLTLPFSATENVYIQSVAGATAFMPFTAGLIGIIPAIEHLIEPADGGGQVFTWLFLLVWSLALCFFGTVIAMVFQKHMINRKDLPFPSAVATALFMKNLPGNNAEFHQPSSTYDNTGTSQHARSIIGMLISFGVAGVMTVISLFIPSLHSIPFLGPGMSRKWLWNFNLSPGIFGQGMITGLAIPLHMLFGTVIGWGLLSPLATQKGWVSDDVNDWQTGSRGWLLWVSLSTLLADCLVNLIWMIYDLDIPGSAVRRIHALTIAASSSIDEYWSPQVHNQDEPENSDTGTYYNKPPPSNLRYYLAAFLSPGPGLLAAGAVLSTTFCIISLHLLFPSLNLPLITFLNVLFSFILGAMSIQALGQADYSPVSSLGKLAQFITAAIIPRENPNHILINLIAGAVAEAGSAQSVELTFDLKTGSLLGADPLQQMYGHVIGSVVGALFSGGLYLLYDRRRTIPGPLFQIPTAYVWVSAAKLAYGDGLPNKAGEFAIVFGVVFLLITFLKILYREKSWNVWLPGGVAFAVGMHNIPAFTLPRALGGIFFWYLTTHKEVPPILLHMAAAGLILGESVFSLLDLFIRR